VDVPSALDGSDGCDPISVLADQIADRLAVKLAVRLAERPPPERSRPPALWTARQVAAHYDVGVGFVYQHADELGCIRLGGGRRPRLRFDPRIVRERWPLVGDAVPEPAPTRRQARSKSSEERRDGRPSYDLIEFDDEP
jgi:hypothetical protein